MSDIFELFKKIETPPTGVRGTVSWLIVGLGNMGAAYAGTRHNAGFYALDAIAEKIGVLTNKAKFHALVGEGTLAGQQVLLMKPQTYMNNSGIAVAEAASFYKLDRRHILIFSDDINLAPGFLRFRQKGSAGGQNGLKNIIEHLGGDDFPRIRVGVGAKPTPEYDLADWVLGKLPPKDRALIDSRLSDVCAGTEALIHGDTDLVSRICNTAPDQTQKTKST